MTGIELTIVIVLGLVIVASVGATALVVVTANRRLHAQNRDQLKAILVLTGAPGAISLASKMEDGEPGQATAVDAMQRPRRLAGA